jgi:membrane peptidoglycan carboxypeptidase
VAGKTGTTQNWSDAWAVGYSPYYTTAIWFGFDKPGNSLGVELTGSTLTGHVLGDYMREIHRGLPRRDFSRPATGIIDVTVCVKSGLLKTAACNEGEISLPFLEGTQPALYCNIHGNAAYSYSPSRMPAGSLQLGRFNDEALLESLSMPTLRLDLLPELRADSRPRIIENEPVPETVQSVPEQVVEQENEGSEDNNSQNVSFSESMPDSTDLEAFTSAETVIIEQDDPEPEYLEAEYIESEAFTEPASPIAPPAEQAENNNDNLLPSWNPLN